MKDTVLTWPWQGLGAGAGSRAPEAGLQVEEKWEMGSPDTEGHVQGRKLRACRCALGTTEGLFP